MKRGTDGARNDLAMQVEGVRGRGGVVEDGNIIKMKNTMEKRRKGLKAGRGYDR